MSRQTIFKPKDLVEAFHNAGFGVNGNFKTSDAKKVMRIDYTKPREITGKQAVTYYSVYIKANINGKLVEAQPKVKIVKIPNINNVKEYTTWLSPDKASVSMSISRSGAYGEFRDLYDRAFNAIWKEDTSGDEPLVENPYNPNIIPMVQRTINKDKDGKTIPIKKRKYLEDPIIRDNIQFEKVDGNTTDKPKVTIKDATKPITVKGKKTFDFAKVNGKPVSRTNIHEFIKAGSEISGVVDLGGLCCSSQGTSIPCRYYGTLIIKPGVGGGFDEDDIFGDDMDEIDASESVVSAEDTNGVTPGKADTNLAEEDPDFVPEEVTDEDLEAGMDAV